MFGPITVRRVEHDRRRLAYLFGDDAVPVTEAYDLTVDADIAELVERLLPDGDPTPARIARLAVRRMVVSQILGDEPPETWLAFERLVDGGLDRLDALRQIVSVMTEQILVTVSNDEPMDREAYAAALEALPLPDRPELATALVAVARAHPGISVDDHVDRTIDGLGRRAGRGLLEPMLDRLLDDLIDGPLHWLSGDRTLAYHDTVADRTFTHLLNGAERELQVISVAVDLAGYQRFDRVHLADGTELEQFSVEPGHLAWRGPDGWLERFEPGDLLSVTATFGLPTGEEPVDATVSIEVAADVAPLDGRLPRLLRDAYDDEQREHGLPVSTEDLVLWMCHRDPQLFRRPLPPLSDWIEAAGLQLDGSLVAHDAAVWRRNQMVRRLGRLADLTPDREVRGAVWRAVEVLPDPDTRLDEVREALAGCAEPEMLDLLADVLIPDLLTPDDEYVLDGAAAPGHVFDMVGRAVAVARRPREIAVAEYLACVLRERCGQPLVAAEHLERAARAQPRLGPVVERLGWYRSDHGDARGAMQAWRVLDEEHPAAATVGRYLEGPTSRAGTGRNDPCWCGSGRKFKQCHLGASELPPLPDRVAWLTRKASLWLEHQGGDTRAALTDLAIAWVAGSPDADASDVWDDDPETERRFRQAFADPILFDTALHEGGLFRRFLRERGELLPDDERLLATAWLTVDRSVHEVVDVERGVGLRLRDLATGEVVDVRERSASLEVERSERYCARVVPDGSTHQIVGGVFPVRVGHETAVLDLCDAGDPVELCAWAGALVRPPTIVHRPGMIESMIDRAALDAAMSEVDGHDPAAVVRRLEAELTRQMQACWIDEQVPALGGLTPREAAADPTRREQLERLLDEFAAADDRVRRAAPAGAGLFATPVYDAEALRRELGLR